MTTKFKTIYAKTKEEIEVKLKDKYPGWEKHTEPELWFYGLRVKMVIKKDYCNG
jgi:hypothetical protein